MTHYGTWVSYTGTARLALAAVLLAAAAALIYAGIRLPLPAGPARPGRKAAVFMLVAWVLAIAAFLACLVVYIQQARREGLAHGLPPDHIFPITFLAAGVTFFIIVTKGRPGGTTALTSAVIAAMAGPMVFELPFDLIVMARTYPPIPPHPALYRALFFAPLLLIAITTLSLLTLSPLARLARATFVSFALMLAVFAIWALAGFGYPSAPVPFALNVVSKLLAFVTVLTLFLPLRAQAQTGGAQETRQPEPQEIWLIHLPFMVGDATDQPGEQSSRPRAAVPHAQTPSSHANQPCKARQLPATTTIWIAISRIRRFCLRQPTASRPALARLN
jgi:hypothetical protein